MERKIMKNARIRLTAIAVAALIGLLIAAGFLKRRPLPEFTYAPIARGEVKKTISSTGTISPVTIVEVGTQVSGTIAKVYADYNDVVKKDQLLAELDTALLKTAILDAEATVEKRSADATEAELEYRRNAPLARKGVVSEAVVTALEAGLKAKRAELKAAEASLVRAKQNFEYAIIRSPINGTVITKNIEEGQTVAANFNTPTLFKIAEDLSNMQILASVNETEIGLIQTGQRVTFEVQTHSGKAFHGIVKKIRLQPQLVSNVVNYTVVIDVANTENLLLPGMTAEVDFIIAQEENALHVPRAALRFSPDEKLVSPGSARAGCAASGADQGRLWYVDGSGRLSVHAVKTGIAGASGTQVDSPDIREGMRVITGTRSVAGSASTGSSKKLLIGGQSGMGGGGPPPSGP